jgi:hypothetical protein
LKENIKITGTYLFHFVHCRDPLLKSTLYALYFYVELVLNNLTEDATYFYLGRGEKLMCELDRGELKTREPFYFFSLGWFSAEE